MKIMKQNTKYNIIRYILLSLFATTNNAMNSHDNQFISEVNIDNINDKKKELKDASKKKLKEELEKELDNKKQISKDQKERYIDNIFKIEIASLNNDDDFSKEMKNILESKINKFKGENIKKAILDKKGLKSFLKKIDNGINEIKQNAQNTINTQKNQKNQDNTELLNNNNTESLNNNKEFQEFQEFQEFKEKNQKNQDNTELLKSLNNNLQREKKLRREQEKRLIQQQQQKQQQEKKLKKQEKKLKQQQQQQQNKVVSAEGYNETEKSKNAKRAEGIVDLYLKETPPDIRNKQIKEMTKVLDQSEKEQNVEEFKDELLSLVEQQMGPIIITQDIISGKKKVTYIQLTEAQISAYDQLKIDIQNDVGTLKNKKEYEEGINARINEIRRN